jgi:D-ornithine 4,5-aminomutase subunit alpha
MRLSKRADDFETRRAHLRALSDEALGEYFWELVERVVAPLIEEARTCTSPSLERSVLLRMGFSSVEAKGLVAAMQERELLAHGAGRLVLELSSRRGIALREAGAALLGGDGWDELPR